MRNIWRRFIAVTAVIGLLISNISYGIPAYAAEEAFIEDEQEAAYPEEAGELLLDTCPEGVLSLASLAEAAGYVSEFYEVTDDGAYTTYLVDTAVYTYSAGADGNLFLLNENGQTLTDENGQILAVSRDGLVLDSVVFADGSTGFAFRNPAVTGGDVLQEKLEAEEAAAEEEVYEEEYSEDDPEAGWEEEESSETDPAEEEYYEEELPPEEGYTEGEQELIEDGGEGLEGEEIPGEEIPEEEVIEEEVIGEENPEGETAEGEAAEGETTEEENPEGEEAGENKEETEENADPAAEGESEAEKTGEEAADAEAADAEEVTGEEPDENVIPTSADLAAQEEEKEEPPKENETGLIAKTAKKAAAKLMGASLLGAQNTTPTTSGITSDWIVNQLGDAADYAVFANEFKPTGHMSGRIAVGTLELNNTGFMFGLDTASGQSYIYPNEYSIKVTKTVDAEQQNARENTFRFGLFTSPDAEAPIETIELMTKETADGIGKATGYFSGKLGNSSLYIFELDGAGHKLGEGAVFQNGDYLYQVTYGNEGQPVIQVQSQFTYDNISYVGNFAGTMRDKTLVNKNPGNRPVIYMGPSNTLTQGGGTNNGPLIENSTTGASISVPDADGDFAVVNPFPFNFSTELSGLSSFSADLARLCKEDPKAGTGQPAADSNVVVYNITATSSGFLTDAAAAMGYSDDINKVTNTGIHIGDDQYVVFNIDMSGVTTSANSPYEVTKYMINGQLTNGMYNNAASRTLFNYYTKSGDTYSTYNGFVSIDTADGTHLLPGGTVTNFKNMQGSMIANSVVKNDGEVHHDPMRHLSQKGTFAATNTGVKPDPAEAVIEAQKRMKGGKADGSDVENGKFHFLLAPGESTPDAPLPENAAGPVEVTNGDGGAVSFGSISFEQEGTYFYTITEKIPETAKNTDGIRSDDKLIYDTAVHTVKVEVTKDPADLRQLKAAVTYLDKDNKAEDVAVFTNAEFEPVKTGFEAQKRMEDGADVPKDKFEFELTGDAAEGDKKASPFPEGITKWPEKVKNGENGAVAFSEITFSEVGEYFYTIREVLPEGVTKEKPTDGTYNYDTAEYRVKVTVTTDPATGKLAAKKEYARIPEDGGNPVFGEEAPTFTNEEIHYGEFRIRKVLGDDETPLPAGVSCEFTLQKEGDSSFEQKVLIEGGGEGIGEFKKLDADTYYILTETAAPDGYMELQNSYRIYVGKDGTVTMKDGEADFESDQYVTFTPAEAAQQGSEPAIAMLQVRNYLYIDVPETGSNTRLLFNMIGIFIMFAGLTLYLLERRAERIRR